jgi:hypothetical protein
MEFRGHGKLEEVSEYLKDESPRCVVIVAAAFFDETLGAMLGDTKERAFATRIDDALAWGLLTPNEHDDLHTLRQLRNEFAHNMRVKDFDASSKAKVATMKLWTTASAARPIDRVIHTTLDQLLFVVGTIGFRLQHRTKPAAPSGPLPEPSVFELSAWRGVFCTYGN